MKMKKQVFVLDAEDCIIIFDGRSVSQVLEVGYDDITLYKRRRKTTFFL